ncbi:MAG: hypothetical protein PHT32_07425, partial [Candidatus Omnitrophica bacterium]|nr:hypothetical protein [Candidatus Omnitrophota bacterium]
LVITEDVREIRRVITQVYPTGVVDADSAEAIFEMLMNPATELGESPKRALGMIAPLDAHTGLRDMAQFINIFSTPAVNMEEARELTLQPKVKLVMGNPRLADLDGGVITIDYDGLISRPLVTLEFHEEFRHYARQADPRGPPTIGEKALLELITDYEKASCFYRLPLTSQADYLAAIFADQSIDAKAFYSVLIKAYPDITKFNTLIKKLKDGYGIKAEKISELETLRGTGPSETLFNNIIAYGQREGVYPAEIRDCLAAADGAIDVKCFLNDETLPIMRSSIRFKTDLVEWFNRNPAAKARAIEVLYKTLDNPDYAVSSQAANMLGMLALVPKKVTDKLVGRLVRRMETDATTGVDEAREDARKKEEAWLKNESEMNQAKKKLDAVSTHYDAEIERATDEYDMEMMTRLTSEKAEQTAPLWREVSAKRNARQALQAVAAVAKTLMAQKEDETRLEIERTAMLIDALRDIGAAYVAKIHIRERIRAKIKVSKHQEVPADPDKAKALYDWLVNTKKSGLDERSLTCLNGLSVEQFTEMFREGGEKSVVPGMELSEEDEQAVLESIRDTLIDVMEDNVTKRKAFAAAAAFLDEANPVPEISGEMAETFLKQQKKYLATLAHDMKYEKHMTSYYCARRLVRKRLADENPGMVGAYYDSPAAPAVKFDEPVITDAAAVQSCTDREKRFIRAMAAAMGMNSSAEGFYWARTRAANALGIFSNISDPASAEYPQGRVMAALDATARFAKHPGDSGYVPERQNFMTSPSSNPVLNLGLSADLVRYAAIQANAKRDILSKVITSDGKVSAVPFSDEIYSIIDHSSKPMAVIEACVNLLMDDGVTYRLKESIAGALAKSGYKAVSGLDVLISLYENDECYGALKYSYAMAIREICRAVLLRHRVIDPAQPSVSDSIRNSMWKAYSQSGAADYSQKRVYPESLKDLYTGTQGVLGKIHLLNTPELKDQSSDLNDLRRVEEAPSVVTLAGGNSTQALLDVLHMLNPMVWVQSLLSTDDDGGSTRNLKALFMKLFRVKLVAPGDIVNASLKVIPMWMRDCIDQRFNADPKAETHYRGKTLVQVLTHGDDFGSSHVASFDEVKGDLPALIALGGLQPGPSVSQALLNNIGILASQIKALEQSDCPIDINTARGLAAHLYTNNTHRNKWAAKDAKLIEVDKETKKIDIKSTEGMRRILRLADQIRNSGIAEPGVAEDIASHFYTHITAHERKQFVERGLIAVSQAGVITVPSVEN